VRINQFIARATGLSRRAADEAVARGRVTINGLPPSAGADVTTSDSVTLDGQTLAMPAAATTIMLNKPAGYVCSRNGQGSLTVYDLLPKELHHLKTVGRLDKDSSGLLLLTDDGDLANRLTHPRYAKEKVYEITLDKPLTPANQSRAEQGVKLKDGPSKLQIKNVKDKSFTVTMSEGRNRQIRRTFEALGYRITRLHRTDSGPYGLEGLAAGQWRTIDPDHRR
jgi:23S rRNA pseudouridine2605 synthase